jgi:tetratricopeptide (TPR) repeat protein
MSLSVGIVSADAIAALSASGNTGRRIDDAHLTRAPPLMPHPNVANQPTPKMSNADEIQRARTHLAKGQLREAAPLIDALIRREPANPQHWQLRAELLLRSGQPDEGTKSLQRAAELSPDNAACWIQYGQHLVGLGRRREALAAANHAGRLPVDRADLLDALGTLYTHCDEPQAARPLYERALALEPGNAHYRYNLATVQRMAGDLADAEANLDKAIAARPTDFEAYLIRADLRTQTPEHHHVDELLRVLSTATRPRGEIALCFALAKELEDIGEFARSFQYLKRGADLQRRSMNYDVAADVATLETLVQTHTAHRLRDGARGFDTEEPLFVIGLPRSGTTLVERIISSHSQVYAAGELNAFTVATIQAVQRIVGKPVSKLEFAEKSLQVDPAELGKAYLEATRPQTGHTRRFTDKMPLNYLYAGLIHRALPGARIVALMRHPLDTCYAMYRVLFKGAYPFSYDLTDLGRYYVAWHRLMQHWQAVIGDAWLTVSYEKLVANQDEVTRRVLSHCGLEWEAACLDFHNHRAAVSTASAVQVRRPLYATSIGKWRHYEAQLAPLRDFLQASGIAVD